MTDGDDAEPHAHGDPDPLRVCPDCGHDLQHCCDAIWPEHKRSCPNYRPVKKRDYSRCPWCGQTLPPDWGEVVKP